MKTKQEYKEDCTCKVFIPYEPKGIVAALQPLGSCTGCYFTNSLPKGNEMYEWKSEDLTETLEKLCNMDEKELRIYLQGVHTSISIPENTSIDNPTK